MRDDQNLLATIAVQLALMSLLAIGGANAVIPELHRQIVGINQWMTDRQFADVFAISQASPGPNVMIVALIGYHVAGFAGALVAILAMCGPTAIVAYFFGRGWDRVKEAPWKTAIEGGLVPISVGLIASSAFIIASAADHNRMAVAITVVTACVAYWTSINPLWVFAAASLFGLAGLL